MWTYQQTTGFILNPDGEHVFTGYSGAGHVAATGRNNPDMQDVVATGPIPQGTYSIGPPYFNPKTGPTTMNLDPLPGTNTFGRSAFRIHGNNATDDASEGCIIHSPAGDRMSIWDSGDHVIQVVRGD
jgi:hypothetical protein